MSIFRRVKDAVSGPDRDLLERGVPRRAGILTVEDTHSYVGVGREPVIEFTLSVSAEGSDFYKVRHKQVVPLADLSRASANNYVVVRVDPQDPERLVIDWSADPEKPLAPITSPATEASMLEAVAALSGEDVDRVAQANQQAYDTEMTEPATIRILRVTDERTVGELRLVRARIAVKPDAGEPFECDFRSLVSDRIRAFMLPEAEFRGRMAPGRRDDADIDFPPAALA